MKVRVGGSELEQVAWAGEVWLITRDVQPAIPLKRSQRAFVFRHIRSSRRIAEARYAQAAQRYLEAP